MFIVKSESYQVIIWFNAKQISEVAESQGSVGLEAEVGVVVCRGQVASLAGMCEKHCNQYPIHSNRNQRFSQLSIQSHSQRHSSKKTMAGAAAEGVGGGGRGGLCEHCFLISTLLTVSGGPPIYLNQ